VSYTVTADAVEPVIPTVALVGESILSEYTASAANTRFTSGLQFNVTNNAGVTVNGGTVVPVSGVVTAATNTAAKTLGSHTYTVIVTSSTGHTASLLVAYQVSPDEAPSISNVTVTGLASNVATITWNTDIESAGVVEYGTTYSLGSTENEESTGTSHSISLTGLSSNRTYYFRVKSTAVNISGMASYSGIMPFTTASADSGIAVNGIETLKSYATADNTYTNGWEFRFLITVNDPSETTLRMKFDDWFGTSGTIVANGNMKIALVDDISGVDAGTAGVTVGNEYTDQLTALSLTDENPNTGGIQETIYVYIKVPATATGGSYSSSYGIHTQ
jgi:hypothetical protein